MSNPINQILFSQYDSFNKAFVTARDKNLEDRTKIAQHLLGLKDEMEYTAHTATAFPETIQSSTEFLQIKIANIYPTFLLRLAKQVSSGELEVR